MSVFPTIANDAMKEPMFFGQEVNIARYDIQKFPVFEQLIDKQMSFFWREHEVDISKDKIDFKKLTESEKHIFISNLKYQTLLDSIQGRSPNLALLPIASIPELETWIEVWSFSETVHSRSYTHILRGIFDNPSEVLDSIVSNVEIQKRASDIAKYYDSLITGIQVHKTTTFTQTSAASKSLRDLKKKLYLGMCSINALEAIRFYVSFACSFAFAERKIMEGNAKIIALIARDESLHMSGTQAILNMWADGKDDPEMQEIAMECFEEGKQIFLQAAEQEKEWAKYLFSEGTMLGLNENILCQYIEHLTNQRMKAIGYLPPFEIKDNPLPWINHWLKSDNTQVAPQEAEISSYLVGQINSTVDENAFEGDTL